jgi:predicted metal-dependent hydrolase
MRSPAVKPIVGDSWNDSQAYTRGVELFNAGYYWEAHEVWEPLWHAHGRCGPTADLIKGLIKLAAAGVKVREGQPHGVQTHARRASELFDQVRREFGPRCLGLDLDEWTIRARQIAETPVFKQVPTDAARVRVFDFQIEPSDDP